MTAKAAVFAVTRSEATVGEKLSATSPHDAAKEGNGAPFAQLGGAFYSVTADGPACSSGADSKCAKVYAQGTCDGKSGPCLEKVLPLNAAGDNTTSANLGSSTIGTPAACYALHCDAYGAEGDAVRTSTACAPSGGVVGGIPQGLQQFEKDGTPYYIVPKKDGNAVAVAADGSCMGSCTPQPWDAQNLKLGGKQMLASGVVDSSNPSAGALRQTASSASTTFEESLQTSSTGIGYAIAAMIGKEINSDEEAQKLGMFSLTSENVSLSMDPEMNQPRVCAVAFKGCRAAPYAGLFAFQNDGKTLSKGMYESLQQPAGTTSHNVVSGMITQSVPINTVESSHPLYPSLTASADGKTMVAKSASNSHEYGAHTLAANACSADPTPAGSCYTFKEGEDVDAIINNNGHIVALSSDMTAAPDCGIGHYQQLKTTSSGHDQTMLDPTTLNSLDMHPTTVGDTTIVNGCVFSGRDTLALNSQTPFLASNITGGMHAGFECLQGGSDCTTKSMAGVLLQVGSGEATSDLVYATPDNELKSSKWLWPTYATSLGDFTSAAQKMGLPQYGANGELSPCCISTGDCQSLGNVIKTSADAADSLQMGMYEADTSADAQACKAATSAEACAMVSINKIMADQPDFEVSSLTKPVCDAFPSLLTWDDASKECTAGQLVTEAGQCNWVKDTAGNPACMYFNPDYVSTAVSSHSAINVSYHNAGISNAVGTDFAGDVLTDILEQSPSS